MARAKAAAIPSRSTSARSSAAAGGARGVYVQTPKSDIFVALLGVAAGAIFLGFLLLLLVLWRYDFSTSVSALAPALGGVSLV
jgi:hypothetical protein